MPQSVSAAGSADTVWSARLHELWRAAQDIDDVAQMSRYVYGLMLAEPGVVAVAGTRWNGRALTYVRSAVPGQPTRTTVAPPSGGSVAGPGRVSPPPGGAGTAGSSLTVFTHDLTVSGEDFDPERAVLAGAGAGYAVECRFGLGGSDWAAFSVGVADRAAADPGLVLRLSQLSEVLVASNQRIVEYRAHERRQTEDAFLAEASLQMDSSLDVQETLGRVARLAVPAVAEGCVVHLFQPDGALVPVASAHVAAEAQPWLSRVSGDDPWFAEFLRLALEKRESVVQECGAFTEGPFGPRAEGFGGRVRALSVSPLSARGKALGTLTFIYHRRSDEVAGLRVLDDLARRAALAIDTTTAYEQRRRHVEQLQHHLLPGALPDWPGLELGAAYQVADSSLEVGGDFYDAVVRADGGLALFVGDVCGRGAEAAALTGLARHTLRTLLEDGTAPAPALKRLNATLAAQSATRFVTALVAVLTHDGDGCLMEVASAGHPRPLVQRADGGTEDVAVGGMLLGVVPEIVAEPVAVRLGPGDTVVMFTDGLTEARSEEGVMFEGLLPDAARRCGPPSGDMAERLIAMASDFRTTGDDDIAVLVAHVKGTR
ncbi:PP2C family protein-serine/threonine phosphatase [Streptomyces uncialis]|uniref:PP2C family protein-serine/threonine phosphatase n=1 Tax=Streptomyces uncialis TaxID=1048205 RepID=UPI00386B6AF1|nr:SpoIIE family protein phosphatase [Streptomyces uncialis]